MKDLFAWAGLLILGGTSLALAISLMFYMINRLLDNYNHKIIEYTKRQISNELISNSWWFTEDKKTHTAIKLLGENLTRINSPGISDVRDLWRKSV